MEWCVMRIVIETDNSKRSFPEPKYTAPSWSTLQLLLKTTRYGSDADGNDTEDEGSSVRDAVITRISRDDHGANYRALGSYTLELRDGTIVRLDVS